MARPSEVIARDRERILRFRDALQRFFATVETDGRSDELINEVSVAAGEARRAYGRNDGRTFVVQDGIYLVPNADPMSHWTSVLDPESDLTPVKVITSLDLSIGRAQERYEDAKRGERGVVGVVSSILRWPSTLRDAVGPSSAQRRAAQTLGIVGQVLVGAVATAISAAIVQAAVLVWQAVFGA
jgi:hypothetical protein